MLVQSHFSKYAPHMLLSKWFDWRAGLKIQQKPGQVSIQRWLPSYIPSRTFSLVLFDIITTAGTEDSAIQETLDSWQTIVQASVESLRQDGKLPDEL